MNMGKYCIYIHLLVSGIGANDLWTTLRSKSRVKLEKEDAMIPHDLKVHKSCGILVNTPCPLEAHVPLALSAL